MNIVLAVLLAWTVIPSVTVAVWFAICTVSRGRAERAVDRVLAGDQPAAPSGVYDWAADPHFGQDSTAARHTFDAADKALERLVAAVERRDARVVSLVGRRPLLGAQERKAASDLGYTHGDVIPLPVASNRSTPADISGRGA